MFGQDDLSRRSNYFRGGAAGLSLLDAPNYGQVVYHNLYQGIDLVYHATAARQLEYDFVVQPLPAISLEKSSVSSCTPVGVC